MSRPTGAAADASGSRPQAQPAAAVDPHLHQTLRSALERRRRRTWDDSALVCAAVLVPLLLKDGQWHVLVTQRTDTVGHHRGQISFPGGACERSDLDRCQTALREAFEEIGVEPEAVDVLGMLDDQPTISDFVVTPVVGVIPHPYPYRLNRGEVQEAVEVPLAFFLNPVNLRVEELEHRGHLHEVLFWDYGRYTIWGLTARILKNLLDLIP